MIEQFFIINKSGGMIFKHEREGKTEMNSLLILTSSLYSIGLMSSRMADRPVNNQVVYLRNRVITMFKTVTSTTFVFVADRPVDVLFERVYAHYCEYVTRNPFYSVEMPINCARFRPHLLFDG